MKKRVLASLLALAMVMSGYGSTPKADETAGNETAQQVTEDNSDNSQTGHKRKKSLWRKRRLRQRL